MRLHQLLLGGLQSLIHFLQLLVAIDRFGVQLLGLGGARLKIIGHGVEGGGQISDLVEATDGQDALSQVFVSYPELILVEHTMPGMNGIVFVQTYHARGGAAPVLMMDKNADRMKVVEALKAGVVSFLLRPIEPDVFAQHILRCLMKRKSA
jgi:DNA-binding NtrC family response regulator